MFADRARIIVKSGKAETVMYPSAEKNMYRAVDRMAAMAVMAAA